MKASEALVTWDNKPEPRVCVGPLGEPSRRSRELFYSGGAAWVSRRTMRGKKQIACVLADFVTLTVKFGLPPKVVHEAFLEIDEHREAVEIAVTQFGPFAELAHIGNECL